ncbi:MAG: hypothetical protein LCH82_17950 [Actinobacteria bacterium]|nr:hypothetical protein [Actinomycetota bacterium]
MSPLTLTAERALHYLAENTGDTLPEGEFTTDEAETAYDELVAAGYINDADVTALGGTELAFHLTSTGRRNAALLRRGYERRLIQRHMLETVSDGSGSTGDLDTAGFLGRTAGADELAEVAKALAQLGHLEGVQEASGNLYMPRLTVLGRRCLETDSAPESFGAVGDSRSHHDNRSYNVHAANIGTVQQGDHNRVGLVDQRIGSNLASAIDLARELRSHAAQVQDPDLAELAIEQSEALEAAAKDGKVSKVRALLVAAASSAVMTFGKEVGGHVADLAGEILEQLPGV